MEIFSQFLELFFSFEFLSQNELNNWSEVQQVLVSHECLTCSRFGISAVPQCIKLSELKVQKPSFICAVTKNIQAFAMFDEFKKNIFAQIRHNDRF